MSIDWRARKEKARKARAKRIDLMEKLIKGDKILDALVEDRVDAVTERDTEICGECMHDKVKHVKVPDDDWRVCRETWGTSSAVCGCIWPEDRTEEMGRVVEEWCTKCGEPKEEHYIKSGEFVGCPLKPE